MAKKPTTTVQVQDHAGSLVIYLSPEKAQLKRDLQTLKELDKRHSVSEVVLLALDAYVMARKKELTKV